MLYLVLASKLTEPDKRVQIRNLVVAHRQVLRALNRCLDSIKCMASTCHVIALQFLIVNLINLQKMQNIIPQISV